MNKGNLVQVYVKKTIQILLSNWSDPLACMACDILYNAILRLFGTDISTLGLFYFFVAFFIGSFFLTYTAEKIFDMSSKGGKKMKLFKTLFITSLSGNLNWFNAIALLNTVEKCLDSLFSSDLWVLWVEHIILFIICTAIIMYVNYIVKNEKNDVRAALGLHI